MKELPAAHIQVQSDEYHIAAECYITAAAVQYTELPAEGQCIEPPAAELYMEKRAEAELYLALQESAEQSGIPAEFLRNRMQ